MIPKLNYSDKDFRKQDTVKGIGKITYYQKFAFLNIEEGAHLGYIEMEKIHSLISYHYKDAPYAFLCNKNVSYSVNPMTYKTLNKIEQLKCIAVVKTLSSTHDIEIERHFITKPFDVFNSFEEATDWINAFI